MVAEAKLTLQGSGSAIETLGNFQLVALDPNRDSALNAGDGNNKMLTVIVVENSFHTVENAAADTYPLAAVQKRPDRARSFRFQKALQDLDFMIRDGGWLVVRSGESEDTAGFQDQQTLFTGA